MLVGAQPTFVRKEMLAAFRAILARPKEPPLTPWRLGRVAPLVLVAWMALDIALRFPPPQWLHVSPVTIALRKPGAYGSFQPGFSIVTPFYGGEAAREANTSPTESRLPLRFSTDRLGFRINPLAADESAPDVVILRGASFIYGAALSDEETLPAALTRVSGLAVRNFSRFHLDGIAPHLVAAWLDQLPAPPAIAVVVYLEHENPRALPDRSRVAALVRAVPALERPGTEYLRARRWIADRHRVVTRWMDFSPLEILARRVERGLANDRVLPNEFRRLGRRLVLPDGRAMLFRDYELAPAREPRGPTEARLTAEFFEAWHARLSARGIETVVLVLPSRYTVYGPVLEHEDMLEPLRRATAYTDTLVAELRSRGITTVDAAAVFRTRAFEEVQSGVLSFYREDNHWNPDGVELVARLLADALTSRSGAPIPPHADTPGHGHTVP